MPTVALETALSDIHGIAPRYLVALKRLGIATVRDLLYHFPSRYEDYSHVYQIGELQPNQDATIQGEIYEVTGRKTWRRTYYVTETVITDGEDSIRAVWWNQPYLRNTLRHGARINISGKVSVNERGELFFSNPAFEFVHEHDEAHDATHTARIVSVYPETRGLTSKGIRYILRPILESADAEEFIPEEILEKEGLPVLGPALHAVHFPDELAEAKAAKRRFAFEDLFLLELTNARERARLTKERAPAIPLSVKRREELIKALPFTLTDTQTQSLEEILADLAKPHPMNRILQGDVGSGKTVIAALAAAAAAEAGHQAAFMAPTEILARQHYETFKKFFPHFERGVALLTGSETRIFLGEGLEREAKKTELQSALRAGKVAIVIGTHALIERGVALPRLAFVVIDEQHRFGVSQRQALACGTNAEKEGASDEKLLHRELTYKIRAALFQVKKELRGGHKEVVYQRSVAVALEKNGLAFSREPRLPIEYQGKSVGTYIPDFVIENKIILELKALPVLTPREKQQLWTYLKGSDYELALLANFGPRELTIDRVIYNRARSSAFVPHFLSMSATPIPRTLALTLFGNLNVSQITELPKDRKAIITKVVAPADRLKAYAFIKEFVKRGRQAFVICPRIEITNEREYGSANATNDIREIRARIREYSLLEMKNVTEEYEKLSKKIFPDLKVSMLHGKLRAKEKADVMKRFTEGATDILVSTSVVEVGVDVPNATVMMVENAERFGLAQLYQFRGRVGRSAHQSFCFLFTESNAELTRKRLEAVARATNGFELAEEDLKLRGPGEFLGTIQTGMPDIAMKALQHPTLIPKARLAAETLTAKNPSLSAHPTLKNRLAAFAQTIHFE